MEKVLVIADIHANPVALEAVLKDVEPVDMVLHAGDIVDYNPWPREALAEVQRLGITSVLGNHDRDSALDTPIGYNPYAVTSCHWTHGQLSLGDQEYLLKLPSRIERSIEGVRIFMCHGSPRGFIDEYVTPDYLDSTLREFLYMTKSQVLILGHTHIPFIKELDGYYVLNPGSVGQSRDGDPRASYVVLTLESGRIIEVRNRRIGYNVDVVADEIKRIGLPSFLAQRLFYGL